MNRSYRRAQDAVLRAANARFTPELREVPRDEWPQITPAPLRVWRSREFLVQEYQAPSGVMRLSINRTRQAGERWDDGISWDDLQRLKREAGYGSRDAVEVFPADADVVNVANMRHLWVMPGPIEFVWRTTNFR